ncbi:MAG: hypothetical protein IPJ61_21685 [Tessaracoccus sp.]|uniref:phage tail tube protein n=1 Tax=Tessaracoccus sp. TaxID=1971211 RepID=UPI001ED4AFF7|nr:phage tail tube protein [Tessaracoccus sp.]MBK7823602.1 hypothetical protein [Tessaracoccus sp.]
MASPRSGLGTQFGYSVAETVYGTAVAATRFRRVRSAKVAPVIGVAEGASLQAGLRSAIGAHRVQTTLGAEGSVEFDATYKDMGLLLQAVFGKTSTSTLKTGTAYEQVHTIDNEDYGLSHTFQVSRIARSSAGTAIPATMTGGKVTAATFSCEVGGVLEVGLTLDGRQFDNTTALAVASYATATPRVRGVDMCVKVGAFGSEAALQGVRSWSMDYSRPLDVGDHTACNSGLKSEPVQNGVLEVTGTLKRDWIDKTLEDQSLSNATTSLQVVWTGALIAGSDYFAHTLTLPGTFIEPASQGIDGPEELTTDWNWRWEYDGTNAPTWKTITTDTAL